MGAMVLSVQLVGNGIKFIYQCSVGLILIEEEEEEVVILS